MFDATSTDGGASWRYRTLAYHAPGFEVSVQDVACSSSSICEAMLLLYGSGIANQFTVMIRTTNGGATWATERKVRGEVGYITRATTMSCVAGGYAVTGATAVLIYSTSNGGKSWTKDKAPFPNAQINWVTRASATHCAILETNDTNSGSHPEVLVSLNGGHSWSVGHSAPGVTRGEYYDAFACSSPRARVIFARTYGAAVVSRTTNFGRSWSRQTSPGALRSVQGAQCSRTGPCVAAWVSEIGAGMTVYLP